MCEATELSCFRTIRSRYIILYVDMYMYVWVAYSGVAVNLSTVNAQSFFLILSGGNANGENFSSSQVKNWWAPTRERKFSELKNNNPDFVGKLPMAGVSIAKKKSLFMSLQKKTVLVKYAVICRNLLSNCFVTTSTVKKSKIQVFLLQIIIDKSSTRACDNLGILQHYA